MDTDNVNNVVLRPQTTSRLPLDLIVLHPAMYCFYSEFLSYVDPATFHILKNYCKTPVWAPAVINNNNNNNKPNYEIYRKYSQSSFYQILISCICNYKIRDHNDIEYYNSFSTNKMEYIPDKYVLDLLKLLNNDKKEIVRIQQYLNNQKNPFAKIPSYSMELENGQLPLVPFLSRLFRDEEHVKDKEFLIHFTLIEILMTNRYKICDWISQKFPINKKDYKDQGDTIWSEIIERIGARQSCVKNGIDIYGIFEYLVKNDFQIDSYALSMLCMGHDMELISLVLDKIKYIDFEVFKDTIDSDGVCKCDGVCKNETDGYPNKVNVLKLLLTKLDNTEMDQAADAAFLDLPVFKHIVYLDNVNINLDGYLFDAITQYDPEYSDNHYWNLINFCIDNGADVNYDNGFGYSCLQAAKDKKLQNVIDLLIKNGAK